MPHRITPWRCGPRLAVRLKGDGELDRIRRTGRLGAGDRPPVRRTAERGAAQAAADCALRLSPAAVPRALARPPRRDLSCQPSRAGRGRLPLRPRVAEAAVHRRPGQHDRPGAQRRPRAAARAVLAALTGGRRAPAPAQADAAAVSRRAHARLRAGDPRGDRARRRFLAAGHRVRAPPEHAGDHARGDPAGGLRGRGRRAPRASARWPRRHPERERLAGRVRVRQPDPAQAAAVQANRDACATAPTSCSTPRSPSIGAAQTSPSATTSSRCS